MQPDRILTSAVSRSVVIEIHAWCAKVLPFHFHSLLHEKGLTHRFVLIKSSFTVLQIDTFKNKENKDDVKDGDLC